VQWSRTEDRAAHTAPARAALFKKFEDQVDPDRKLSPAQREKQAAAARKAHFLRLAERSAQVRKSRRLAKEARTEAS
jgi:hypothetical protein